MQTEVREVHSEARTPASTGAQREHAPDVPAHRHQIPLALSILSPSQQELPEAHLSESNVEACAAAKIEPLIALKRERHHASWRKRFAPAPKAPPDSASAMQKMAHRLKTPQGRKLDALRKQTPEPVFGIIKSVMGFRQFLLRGAENAQGEWNLVTMSWNIRRM